MDARHRASARARWGCVLLPLVLAGCWSYVSKEAQQRLLSSKPPVSVTVFPVQVVKGPVREHDAALAARLADFLRQEGMAVATVATARVDLHVQWHHNQARMAKESALGFGSRVGETGITTQYALLAEILCNPTETQVIGVHFYLAEQGGALAAGGLTNSHWEEFQAVKPADRNGGYEVLTRMLRKGWTRP
jgi:hypothetical protein